MLDGAVHGVEEGWFQSADRRFGVRARTQAQRGSHVIVGVNAFLEGNDEPPPETLRDRSRSGGRAAASLEKVHAERNAERSRGRWRSVRVDTTEPTINLMPTLLDA